MSTHVSNRKYTKSPKKTTYKKRPIKNNRIQSVVIRTPGVAVPDRMFVQLNYMDTTSRVLAAAGNPFGYIRYFSNGMFDANPLILTSPIPGFTELASLYEQYRVHSIKVSLRFCNPGNISIRCTHLAYWSGSIWSNIASVSTRNVWQRIRKVQASII